MQLISYIKWSSEGGIRTSLGIFSHKVSTMAVEKAFLCMDTVAYRYWWDYNPPVHRKWEPSGRHWRCTMHSLVNNQPAPGIWQGQQAPLRHQPQQLELQVPSLPPPLLGGYFYCVSVNFFFFFLRLPLIQQSQASLELSLTSKGHCSQDTIGRMWAKHSSSRKPFMDSWWELVVWWNDSLF